MSDPIADLVERELAATPEADERLKDAEVARRLDEYDRGEVRAIDAADVFENARRLVR